MPELPEILQLAGQMDREFADKTISGVRVFQEKCINMPVDAFVRLLSGRRVVRVASRGKWVFVELELDLEIFVDREGEVILKKYSPIGELGDFAKEYADSLHEAIGHIACIADRDNIIAVAGAAKKEFLNKPIGAAVEKVMEERKPILISKAGEHPFCKGCLTEEEEETCKFSSEVIAPIISEGDPIGAVIICSKEPNVKMGELELKLAETAAGFLAKQMEQ